jgi:hypothetical protein
MTEQAEQALDAGESLNCIFGASLKDEPTKRSKDKVRISSRTHCTPNIDS